jgi:hypothetical protein
MLKSVCYSEVHSRALNNCHWIMTWSVFQITFDFGELTLTRVSQLTFDFCWMVGTYQNSTYCLLIAICMWRCSDISFITFLGIKVSKSRVIRVEQDYEHVRHRSRRMRKVVISSKSVFNLPCPEFRSKMCPNKITTFTVFLNIAVETQKNLKIPFFTRSVASQQ